MRRRAFGPVIGAIENSLLTEHLTLELPYQDGCACPILRRACTSCACSSATAAAEPSGAASSGVRRTGRRARQLDRPRQPNLIVVGDDDGDMARAVNRLIELQGGCVAVAKGAVRAELPLPIAGLMSDRPFEEVASRLRELRRAARAMGSAMTEPFLQLAFLPLPVIPTSSSPISASSTSTASS